MVLYAGGDGSSMKKAVKIVGATNSMEGIRSEYEYLAEKFGVRGRDWDLNIQALLEDKGKSYDAMTIRLKDGKEITLYFDITDFFGKG